jgi:RNA polymerase sigma factor for flagellar operon FliA
MAQQITKTNSSRDQLIMDGMAQVKLVARRIHSKLPGSVNLEDLISAGTVGLIMAIDRYDASQGVQLKTYAEYKIRGAILDSLRTADWAPRLQRKRARLIDTAIASIEAKLHRTPTAEEVAAELGISIDEYRDWTGDINGLIIGSLDSAPQEEGRDLLQVIADTDQLLPLELLEKSELTKLVGRAVERMPKTERTVITMYYQHEMTLREIAKTMKLHESRISQLKTQAINRLRTFLAAKWPERGEMVAAA